MAERDPFVYAHQPENRDRIVWMSQNTNHIPTTPAIGEAVKKALAEKEFSLYPYWKGVQELRDEVVRDLHAEGYDSLITNGAIEALYIANRALLKPGDEVIATDPSFMPIHHQVSLSDAKPIEIDIYKKPWRLTPEEVESHITRKTKIILLIDPHNPMGSEYTRDEVKAISESAKKHDLYLIDDVTYKDFAFRHTLTTEFYPEKTILIYSFSKNCGMAGMRVGALLAPPDLMKIMEPYNTNVLSVNILAQRAALSALKTKEKWIGNVVGVCRENQRLIKEAVDKIEGAFLPVYPSSTNMFPVDISGTGLEPDEVQKKLLYEHDVFVRSGRYVSKKLGARFIRVSFSVPTDGCRKFVEALPVVIEELREKK
jgi:aspartate aminotransferase